MITPLGVQNERNRSCTIDDINNGLPSRKNQVTPFNLKFHDKIMNAMPLRTRASFSIVVGNYIPRYMREFVNRHGGTLYVKGYYKDYINRKSSVQI